MIVESWELPSGWAWASFPELARGGGAFSDGDWVESKDQDPTGDVRLIQLADVGDGYYRDKSRRFLTKEKASELGCTFLEVQDVLISRLADPLGRACLFPGDEKACVTVVDVALFRSGDHGLVDHSWLKNLINSPQFRGEIDRWSSGTTRKRVSRRNLEKIRFPLPPLNEQRRIVAKVDSLQERSDAAREALDAIPPLLERFRQSVLAAAFRGDLTRDWRKQNPDVEPASALLERIRAERKARFIEDAAEKARAKAEDKARKSGMDWSEADSVAVLEKERTKAEARYKAPTRPVEAELPGLPPTWSWATYDEVVEVQLGQRRAPEFQGEEERPYIRSANITWSGLDLGDVKTMGFADPRRLLLEPGDVLLNEASGSKTEVGKPALWNGELSGCCFQATVLRLRAYSDELLPKWIYFHCLRDALLAEYAARCPGLGIIHLTAKLMRSWPIPVAPPEEQGELASRLSTLLDGAAAQESSLAAARAELRRLDQTVLARAFRGELVPQDRSDESASELLKRIREQADPAAT